MQLKELSDSVFEIDGMDIFYSFGRKLLEERIPDDKRILLLLDPLFLTIFVKNIKKILEAGKKEITVLFIPFDNMDIKTVDNYFAILEETLSIFIKYNDCELKFITPSEINIIYTDGTYFNLANPLFVRVINSFEKEYLNMLKEERMKNAK